MKENKITSGVVLILLASFLLTFLYRQSPKIAQDTSSTNLQGMCASQAKIFFEYYIKISEFGTPNDRQGDEYTNHFSVKLNKCFILITNRYPYSVDDADVYKKDLYDATEKKQYGAYRWWVYKNTDGELGVCKLFPNGNTSTDGTLSSLDDLNKFKVCHSEAEFDTLVKEYMES